MRDVFDRQASICKNKVKIRPTKQKWQMLKGSPLSRGKLKAFCFFLFRCYRPSVDHHKQQNIKQWGEEGEQHAENLCIGAIHYRCIWNSCYRKLIQTITNVVLPLCLGMGFFFFFDELTPFSRHRCFNRMRQEGRFTRLT